MQNDVRSGGRARPRTRGRGQYLRFATPYLLLTPAMVLLVVLMVLPIVMVLVYSVIERAVVNPDYTFIGLESYTKVLSDDIFWDSIVHTALFSLFSVIAHFALGLFFAMVLNSDHLNRRLRTALRSVFLLPWLFTMAVVAVLWRMILNPSGVLNWLLEVVGLTDGTTEWLASSTWALPVLICVNIWAGYPLYMVSLLAGLQSVPKDLQEASLVDRAGAVSRFRYVTLPHLWPIMISLGLLDFIWTSQQFPLVWLLTGGGPIHATEVAPTYIYKLAFSQYQFGQASAAAVVLLGLTLILGLFYLRHQRANG